MLPPLELHDPIAHALEEPYIESTRARRKLYFLFCLLACHNQEYAYASQQHIVLQSTMTSPQTVCHALELTYVMWTH